MDHAALLLSEGGILIPYFNTYRPGSPSQDMPKNPAREQGLNLTF